VSKRMANFDSKIEGEGQIAVITQQSVTAYLIWCTTFLLAFVIGSIVYLAFMLGIFSVYSEPRWAAKAPEVVLDYSLTFSTCFVLVPVLLAGIFVVKSFVNSTFYEKSFRQQLLFTAFTGLLLAIPGEFVLLLTVAVELNSIMFLRGATHEHPSWFILLAINALSVFLYPVATCLVSMFSVWSTSAYFDL
jgi:hypothetical protein